METGETLAESPQIGILFQDPTSTPTPTPKATLTATGTDTPEVIGCIPPEDWVEYFVQSGDTLFNLAVATGSTVEKIRQANCLENNVLSVNGGLWLPQLPPTPTPTPTPTYTSTPTSTPPLFSQPRVTPTPNATDPPKATVPPPPTKDPNESTP